MSHLEETNLNYFQHLKYGMMHAGKSCYVVWTSFWHALNPEWFPYVAETLLAEQYALLEERRAERIKYQKGK